MADKEKKLRKILEKIGRKGRLKLVATLEEAHLVLVEDKRCCKRSKLLGKGTYLEMIEKGYTAPEEEVYYVTATNPRDRKTIEGRYLSNAFAVARTPLK